MVKRYHENPSEPLLTDKSCHWCGDKLPITCRSDTKYCRDRCRYDAAVDRGNTGKIRSTTVLKDGRISVVVYMPATTLRAGQTVKVGPAD